MRTGILLGAAVWLLSALGCAHYEPAAFNKPKGVNGREILLIPFRESRKRLWYTESQRGLALVADLKSWAYEEADDPLLVEGAAEKDVLETIRSDEKWILMDRVTGDDWKELVGNLGVQFVLVGDIRDLTLRDPGTIGLYQPKMVLEIEVFDVPRGKKAYSRKLEVTDPSGRDDPMADVSSFNKDSVIERRLIRQAAERIGQELYGYYEKGG
ncbi:MAG: hypothetical protein JXA90_04915 [Planctomycetes bacterium]|nr:hypothetical protein [Planctomycetota bacterium]